MHQKTLRLILSTACCLVLSACTPLPGPAETGTLPTDRVDLYFNGPILTMLDQPAEVSAVAVRGDVIVGVGQEQSLREQFGNALNEINLQGRTLMPGFFDSHSHATLSAAKLAVVNLDPPPAGPADSIENIQIALRRQLQQSPPAPGEWLIGWGYDNAMLAEGRHPDRHDLDAVSSRHPILLIHFSTHQVVLNSLALQLAGINADTPDPEGGFIEREADGRQPNGILQENAIYSVLLAQLNNLLLGQSTDDTPTPAALQRLSNALDEYARQGFTTVTEMGATPVSMTLLQAISTQDELPVDVIAVAISKAYSTEQIAKLYAPDYRQRLRVGGTKIILDGGSPGRSAWLRAPYYKQLEGENGYRGYPHIAEQDNLNHLMRENYSAAIPVYVHALGDAAVDQAIAGLRFAQQAVPAAPARTQLIHVQQAQEDQLDALVDLNASLSFQMAHNYYFADYHREHIYGPQRTARLNPAGSALRRGLSVSIHHDSPVHPIDQFTLIWAAVNRVSRSGQVHGEAQKITVSDALKASTINAAWQFYEETTKGTIEIGKQADLIVLSDNPLAIDPARLRDIQVLRTIKAGKTIFAR